MSKGSIKTDDNRMLYFKGNVSLAAFTEAMRAFNSLYLTFAGREATYDEFTDWLVEAGFVDQDASVAEINALMEKAADHA